MIDTESVRKKVLDLAMLGHLTDRLDSDGSAEALFTAIQKEKNVQIKKGLLRKTKDFPKIDADKIPGTFPKEWYICYIDDVAFVTKLAGFEYTKYIADNIQSEGIPLFKGKNVQHGNLIMEFESFIPKNVSDELPRSQLKKKCLLTPYVGTIGNIAIFNGEFEAHLGSNVGKIEILNSIDKTYLLEEYVLYYLRSSFGYSELTKHKKATAQDSISIEAIRNVILPIPPVKEQQKIVNVIEEIFEQLDIIDIFQSQYTSNVEILKNKLIDAGIRGKLTEQLPEDGDAEDLYNQIQDEKARLIKESKIKKEKPLPDISEDEIPFEIPKSWKWVRIGKVINEVIVPQRDKPSFSGNIPWCRIEDRDGIYLNGTKSGQYVSEETIREMNLRIFPVGTVLSACSGASIGTILVNTVECCTNQTFNGLVCNDLFYNWYLFWFLKSEINRLKSMGSGSAMAYISQDKIRNMLIPLPPIAEQKRIVEKLEAMMELL